MKTLSVLISSALLLVLSTSCSRQVTSLNSGSQLKSVSVLEKKHEITVVQNGEAPAKMERPVALPVTPETATLNCSDDLKPSSHSFKSQYGIDKALKIKANAVKSLVFRKVNELSISHNIVAERGDPQINKAGFIFIAAAILGYFLHLILIACIIIGVIGLIILLSPLFHKRY